MSIPGSAEPLLLAQQDTGYRVERSLRFNASDSAYLSRTPASAGNRKTWTWAGWVKRGSLSGTQWLFECSTSATYYTILALNSDAVYFYDQSNGAVTSTALYRDPGAWMHLVLAVDTTQATASNRVKMYVNGAQITALSGTAYPTQNADTGVNSATLHSIGARFDGSYSLGFNGYLADVHFIDGQALTPSSFTEVSATTGQLIPKAYTGSFGTNGFWLKFSDNSAATATTLGKDYSGNSNNWTPNNLSVTAGADNDSLTDTPTSYGTDTGAGGEVRGNYATFNPLRGDGFIGGLTNGNLDVRAASTGQDYRPLSTIGVSSGKWYWEVTKTYAGSSSTDFIVGIANAADSGSTYSSGSQRLDPIDTVYGVSLDFDTLTFAIKKNNVALYSTSIVPNTYFAYVNVFYFGAAASATVNFGQRPFAYTAPSGFKALCDTNLPAPVVAKPNTAFDALVFAATNTNNTVVTGLNFQPDLVWGKSRTNAYDHQLFDSVRGVYKSLTSNNTNAESNLTVGVTSFNSDGFTAGRDFNAIYGSGSSVAWCWDAGSSTVTNTQGSITSQVRANPSAGFSIVTYTGTSSSATIGHGLNVAPSLVIVKNRDAARDWCVYHASLGNGYALILQSTLAQQSSSAYWNSTSPTSSVFSVGTSQGTGGTNDKYVAYCFAPVAGYSSFGSYTGNGSADGPFVYTGFRPRFVIQKQISAGTGGQWIMFDSARKTYNSQGPYLFSNDSAAEGADAEYLDFLSNGFKFRTTNATLNGSAVVSIYIAFAENPFQYARAR